MLQQPLPSARLHPSLLASLSSCVRFYFFLFLTFSSRLSLFLHCQVGPSVSLSYSCPLSTGFSSLSDLFLSLLVSPHQYESLSLPVPRRPRPPPSLSVFTFHSLITQSVSVRQEVGIGAGLEDTVVNTQT